MTGIRSLLFDIDGTLLDTTEFILKAAEHALTLHGYPIPDRSTISKLVGKSFDEFYGALSGSDNIIPLQNAHREFQKKNLHLSVPYPHTLAILTRLREHGFKMAAVTSRSKITSLETLRRANIHDFFDVVISEEDAPRTKPDPDPLLKALELLDEEPSRSCMIGDSHADIEAGISAGCKTIRALYGFHAERLHDPEPDFFIADISDVLKIFNAFNPRS